MPCVLVDPNRRDILYAMHEDSTVANPRIYRYTSMSRRRNSGKKVATRRWAHEVANEPLVGAALVALSQTTYKSNQVFENSFETSLISNSWINYLIIELFRNKTKMLVR